MTVVDRHRAGRRCAFLTLQERGDFVIDDDHALEPLASLGWQTDVVSWRQTETPWSDYDVVIIRSTWDYWDDVEGFMQALQQIDSQTRLANPLGLVRWNLAKTYLRDLERQGVPIVPTLWHDHIDSQAIRNAFAVFNSAEIVVKPVVGANGVDAFRLHSGMAEEEFAKVAGRFPESARRGAMAQPFMPCIISEGEFSLFYFNGKYSHAILKVPQKGEFRSQEERGAEIRSVKPEPRLLARVEQAMATLKPPPLYARIDLVRDAESDFRIMELELIEPSMYLRTEAGAPMRFAHAIDDWVRL
jgi:glutathione synthase/RimK-type ligase-like ATP-grasp enzyme